MFNGRNSKLLQNVPNSYLWTQLNQRALSSMRCLMRIGCCLRSYLYVCLNAATPQWIGQLACHCTQLGDNPSVHKLATRLLHWLQGASYLYSPTIFFVYVLFYFFVYSRACVCVSHTHTHTHTLCLLQLINYMHVFYMHSCLHETL